MSDTLLFLPGDGIGPEVLEQAARVVDWLAEARGLAVEIDRDLVGGASFDRHGTPLTDECLAKARAAKAVLMGAVGGPQWADVPYDKRPEAGLLALRKGMNVFANLRPAVCFEALADASALKRPLVEGLDIMIVRELVGGLYFGTPRGIDTLPSGERRGYNSQVYETAEIRRCARVAFEIARARKAQGKAGHVTSCDKANVLESGVLWREEVTRLHSQEFPDIQLAHMYADNCAMQLVRAPKQFDVILCDNFVGDIISDEASMLTGSIGMLPSAALGLPGTPGLYEPVHGSAPDIAGKGVANPLGAILSLEMALRFSLNRAADADLVRAAVEAVLDQGARTADLWTAADQRAPLSTRQLGEAVIGALEDLI